MATPAAKPADIKRAVRLVEDALRAGYPAKPKKGQLGAIGAAGAQAESIGFANAGVGDFKVRHHIKIAEARGCGPDWTLKPEPKPKRKRTPALIVEAGPRDHIAEAAKMIRVGVIPDAHLAPGVNPERMRWIGRFFADEGVEEIIQVGDLGTFDSVSAHAQPGTLDFEKLPRAVADFDAVERGLDLFAAGLGAHRARKRITKGNHEHRLDRFENANPQTQGMFVDRFDALCDQRGWGVYPYREYAMVGGVGFIHIPINAAGKPYGGKLSAQRIANDALFSIVHGHTHVRQSAHAAKLGVSRLVSVISPGCALPWGHVEDYARHNATGWWWGVAVLTIRNGVILDEAYVSMLTLERRYRERRKGKAHVL